MDLKWILEDFNTFKKNTSSAAKVLKEIFNEAKGISYCLPVYYPSCNVNKLTQLSQKVGLAEKIKKSLQFSLFLFYYHPNILKEKTISYHLSI